ncbi:SGNH/GDSL hydrolase family protein [Patescibacteria group bacterium]
MFLKKYYLKILLMLFSAIITFVSLEVGVRLLEYKSSEIPFTLNINDYKDDVLGWKGKMIFGSLETVKRKIFIIGDSFTDGNGVSEEDMYYSKIKNSLDVELFIYGGIGYGTLQELLVLERYINSVNPDLILIQITSNDIINNNVELERRSIHNNLLLRPYYIRSRVQMLYPSTLGLTRYYLTLHSRLLQRIFEKTDTIRSTLVDKQIIRTIDTDINEKGSSMQEYKNAVEITDILISKIISIAGNVPVLFMPAVPYEPYYSALKHIVEKRNGYWIEEPLINITDRIMNGENVLQDDGCHWNELGHKYVGEVLSNKLIDYNLIPDVTSP